MHSINIPDIAKTLKRSKFKNNFEFEVGGKTGVNFKHDIDFADERELIDYIKTCCDNNHPLIVVIGPRNGPPAHIIVVIGYDNNGIISFFDPANNCNFYRCVCYKHELELIGPAPQQSPFKENLPTLLIKPR